MESFVELLDKVGGISESLEGGGVRGIRGVRGVRGERGEEGKGREEREKRREEKREEKNLLRGQILHVIGGEFPEGKRETVVTML